MEIIEVACVRRLPWTPDNGKPERGISIQRLGSRLQATTQK